MKLGTELYLHIETVVLIVRLKTANKLRKVIIGAGITTVGLAFWASQAFYTVTKVIDGDTFVTNEKQYVRFDKVDAPEINNCLGEESKVALSNLILGKKVFLKVNFIEKNRNRLVASVYAKNGNIQAMMLNKGLGTLRGGLSQKDLNIASDNARRLKLGVYSSICTQSENIKAPKFNIKGNVRHNEKYYRYLGCAQYETTIVQLHFGDKWFCSEKEALEAGFTKAGDCK